MNNFPPPYSPVNGTATTRLQTRHSGDFRKQGSNGATPSANGNGPMPVPTGPNRIGNGHPPNMRGIAGSGTAFDGPRSPPNSKNTSHVPCKFFRQGACQAGKACPFLHSNEPTAEAAPCKYFQKGNCKFGQKCALAHILPDGRRVNRPIGAGAGINIGGRVPLFPNQEAPTGSSLLTMQAHMAGPNASSAASSNYPYPIPDEYLASQSTQRPPYDTIPTIDTTFSSHPGSNYGSPPNEGRMIGSPVQKGLSVLDAPLPASFDSQGISHMARYGPIAASVPSRFGLGTSPPSSFQDKSAIDSPALRNLHNSAFGDDIIRNSRNGLLGSSPPATGGEDFLTTRRIMHSERFSRSKMLSSSLGARAPLSAGATDDWDDPTFTFEEDLVPTSLQELLTPQEKMRRFSRTAADEDRDREREAFLFSSSHRACLSGLGTPADNASSKVGSPLASSPSRFGPLFTRSHGKQPNDTPDSATASGSVFGHVGSPLRSTLHPAVSPSLRAQRPLSGDLSGLSPYLASPPRQAGMSMSMISQQLQRTKLGSRNASGSSPSGLESPSGEKENNNVLSGLGRLAPPGTGITSAENRLKDGRLQADRAVSSSSLNRAERIEEEQGVFNMEEDESDAGTTPKEGKVQPVREKRYSGGLGAAWGGWGLPGKRSALGSSSSLSSGIGNTAEKANGS